MPLIEFGRKARLEAQVAAERAKAEKAAAEADRKVAVAEGEALRVRGQELERDKRELVDAQFNILSKFAKIQEDTKTYTGNDYKTYPVAVNAISRKYNAQDDWGCLQTGTIIDLRAAFILGDGVKVVPTTETPEEAAAEVKFAEDFLDWNDLDAEMAPEFAKEAEIEGKIALTLSWEKMKAEEPWHDRPGMVSVRFLSWTENDYKVIVAPDDYLDYQKITWTPKPKIEAGQPAPAQGSLEPRTLEAKDFVYKKFGGRLARPNEAQPKLMKCLTYVDRLDKALRDLREINHLFASPTPSIEVTDPKQIPDLQVRLDKLNWKIGMMLIHTGTFQLVSADAAGATSLIAEIELCMKVISGTTGIPIHYLGLLDLLKNRATGVNTVEVINASTDKERKVWTGAYMELITKAMNLYNAQAGTSQLSKGKRLDPTKIKVKISSMTQEHWDHIEKVLIPASLGGIISKEYVASQIPGIDTKEETKKRDAAKKEEAEKDAAALKEMKETALELDKETKPS